MTSTRTHTFTRTYAVGVGVAAYIQRYDNAVLLIQRGPECSHGAGQWSVPGGWLEVGETPAAAAIRETWEETRMHVTARDRDAPTRPTTTHYDHEAGVFSSCLWVSCTWRPENVIDTQTGEQMAANYVPKLLEPGKVVDARWAQMEELLTWDAAAKLNAFPHLAIFIEELHRRHTVQI